VKTREDLKLLFYREVPFMIASDEQKQLHVAFRDLYTEWLENTLLKVLNEEEKDFKYFHK